MYRDLFTGFSLHNRLYQKLCVRYASKDLTINMNDFILLSVKLEQMFSKFRFSTKMLSDQ